MHARHTNLSHGISSPFGLAVGTPDPLQWRFTSQATSLVCVAAGESGRSSGISTSPSLRQFHDLRDESVAADPGHDTGPRLMVAPSVPRDARSKIPPGPEGSNGIDRCGRRGQPAGTPPQSPTRMHRKPHALLRDVRCRRRSGWVSNNQVAACAYTNCLRSGPLTPCHSQGAQYLRTDLIATAGAASLRRLRGNVRASRSARAP